MNDCPASRIVLRPIGSPLTLGLSGLAIASLVQSGLDLHWLDLDQTHDVGLIMLTVPFVLQIVACVFSYLARDGAGGAAVGVLSASWLAVGLVHVTSVPGSRSGALGLMLVTAGAVLLVSSLAVGVSKPLVATVFVLAALRFITGGVYYLGAPGFWQNAGGIIGLGVVGTAVYCLLAFELEGQLHHAVLPTFRRGRGAAATLDDPASSINGVVNEPGVRQTT
jgi:succinate-acetate transporter protein